MGGSGPDRRGDDDAPGGATAGVTAGDRVAAAVQELYGADPEAFTGRRGELVTAARTAGDRAAAKAIAALRRPTRAAWVVNRLARTDPGAPPRLTELATALRAAQEARDGPRLRELSAERGALVDALTAQALAAADVADPPASLRLEVGETLQAALADPEVAAAFATGTLTRAAQWSGFGLPLAGAAPDRDEETREAAPAPKRPEAAPRNAGRARDAGRSSTAVAGTARRPSAGAGAGADRAAAAAATARRQAEEDERLARAAAERAARRREQIEEAERAVAAAATAATEASSAEDRLEATVRDLEQRLTRARTDLAAARMRARHAEAAERRARQAMDRLLGE